MSLDSEIIMKNGEPIGTQTPTGHYVLLDTRFEPPTGMYLAHSSNRTELNRTKTARASNTKLAHAYSVAVAWHALTRRSEGQMSRSYGYENRQGHMAASSGSCGRRATDAGVGLHVV